MITAAKLKIARLTAHREFRRYFSNTSWMFAEQFLRLVAGLFVGIYVARYLGPEQFGILSYATAFVALFAVIARLGMDGIMVRELVNHPAQRAQDLGAAFWIMTAGSISCVVAIFIIAPLLNNDSTTNLYIFIIASGLLFQSFFVIDYHFQSLVQAKYVSICKVTTLTVSSSLKLYLVYIQADLIGFAIIALFDQVAVALMLAFAGWRKGIPPFYSNFILARSKELLRSSWPLILTALAITLNMRIDQLMINVMLGEREVGLYSSAVRIYEAWLLVPYVVSVSLLPAIIKSKATGDAVYQKRLVWLFRVFFWSSVAVAALTYFTAEFLITHTFGPAYLEAVPVLKIVMFTTAFAALGSGSARYFIAEKMESKFALRTSIAAALNVILNLIFIPRIGIEGAAIATLLSTFTVSYLMDWFDPELKMLLAIKHRAIFLQSS